MVRNTENSGNPNVCNFYTKGEGIFIYVGTSRCATAGTKVLHGGAQLLAPVAVSRWWEVGSLWEDGEVYMEVHLVSYALW